MSDAAPTTPDLGALYRGARERIAALVSEEVDAVGVPATPGWTVHDVVAHLSGIVEDALSGNVTGAATDPWTAEQVARGRDKPLAQLLEEWTAGAPLFEQVLSSPAGASASSAVFDVHTHECDLRGALGVPHRDSDTFAAWAFAHMAERLVIGAREDGLPPLRIATSQGDRVGAADASASLNVDRHEFIRAVLGRRAPEQMRAWDWSVDPEPYLTHIPVFGPRDTALVD